MPTAPTDVPADVSAVPPTPGEGDFKAVLSFETVFESELGYVLHTLRRLGVRTADLEDVAQEVFMAVAAHLDEFDPQRPLRPWIFGFAFRFVSNYQRHSARKHHSFDHSLEPSLSAEASLNLSPRPNEQRADVQLASMEARTQIHQVLAQLPLEERALLTLFEMEEQSAQEVAEALSMPVSEVYSRLRTARARFRRVYQANNPPSEEVSL